MEHKTILIVRGGGDLASGVIHRLYKCGYRVLVLECRKPSAIRRKVSFGEAVFDGTSSVENVTGRLIGDVSECQKVWDAGEIPVLVDETGEVVKELKPDALIDAILAKKNLGTTRAMAPLTVALGPGFEAGKDVDFVIETQRGHNLGRVISKGAATPNTGIPGVIAGYGKERVIHSPAAGIMHNRSQIGDIVEKNQVIAMVDDTPVYASLTGVLRGIIRDGYEVPKGMKIADIDPRKEQKKNCDTISDKARCIAGSVVEVLMANGVLP
ncbi:selenium-dependent molybdenum cofactor biosynthesis protein YqeB [Blautia sp. MSJ-19]|uniref:selenium-dependent molybdenum cofactor biosynthesis protein YqeB n=1 Tax=Blautia sp. MSJ-19 TaxID=2841517 RepID=UPI001C0EE966|nr:selenium-dependent molybdenum cofactor biosynthesis protein YqeB [Blautia sp. MSJ-19]MBU5482356.1 EF2563 family selenium-dependent molybdenum hydroxylase system protein [Blautia sp. MSJ-19]